jgi:hypothetical protein
MKKIFCALAVLVIMVVCLVGCGNNDYDYDYNYNYNSKTNTSSTSVRTCKFKEGNEYVCSSPCNSAPHFCSYYVNYLNDAYNDMKDIYDSLK